MTEPVAVLVLVLLLEELTLQGLPGAVVVVGANVHSD